MIDQSFHIPNIHETRLNENIPDDSVKICGCGIFRNDGGVALYIRTVLNAKLRHDLVTDGFGVIRVEINRSKSKPFIIGT